MFVPPIAPQDSHILTISLVSPSEVGQFKSQFCLCTPTGTTFGPIIWSVVDVSTSGTLSLTQQLTQLHTSQPKPQQQQQSGCLNWDDGMDVTSAGPINSISTALVPHCSNLIAGSGPFPMSNQVSLDFSSIKNVKISIFYSRLSCQLLKTLRRPTKTWWLRKLTVTTCKARLQWSNPMVLIVKKKVHNGTSSVRMTRERSTSFFEALKSV